MITSNLDIKINILKPFYYNTKNILLQYTMSYLDSKKMAKIQHDTINELLESVKKLLEKNQINNFNDLMQEKQID